MDLHHVSIEARTRTPWEALDLGFVMTRQWWTASFWSWFIPSAILYLVLSIVFYKYPSVAMIAAWWLKPLWDRGPLYIASQRLFGKPVTLRETLLKLPTLYKSDWFIWLTWRRFSPTRAFDMPLTVLEQIKGKQRTSRQSLLHRRHASAATCLTIVCMLLEYILLSGSLSFIYYMLPDSIELDAFNVIIEGNSIYTWTSDFLFLLAMSLIAPFYAISGFALYISRRIDLEAWDIEIKFRLLAENLSRKAHFPKALTSLALCCCMLLTSSALFTPQQAIAATEPMEEATSSLAAESAKAEIIEILDGNEFHQIDVSSGWRLKDFEQNEFPDWLIPVFEFLFDFFNATDGITDFFSWLASVIEFILWSLAIGLVLWLIYRYRQAIRNFTKYSSARADKNEAPKAMFGLDLTQESLPDDIPKTVRDLWHQEDYRAATSLLYRAMLSGLIHQYDFSFSDGYTEGECVRIVQKRGMKELSRYTKKLTQCWQQLAYGHLLPEFSEIDNLCNDWEEIFSHE